MNLLFLSLALFISFLTTTEASAEIIVPKQPSEVKVEGTVLFVSKRLSDESLGTPSPFIIHGATWAPGTKATAEGPNPLKTSETVQYGFFFHWPGRNPDGYEVMNFWNRNEFAAHYEKDIGLMQEASMNTVRVYQDFSDDPAVTKKILDEMYRRGVFAIVNVVASKADFDSKRYLQTVKNYKDHPAVLMWEIGNEWNLNKYLFYGYDNLQDAVNATNEAIAAIKEEEKDSPHPISSVLGDRFQKIGPPTCDRKDDCCNDPVPGSDVGSIVAAVPGVDIWGLNIYRGESFYSLFADWQGLTSKPFYMSEFGIDSFATKEYKRKHDDTCKVDTNLTIDVKGEEDRPKQELVDKKLWSEIEDNLSAKDAAKSCLGGTVHQFQDQLWKVGNFNIGLGGLVDYDGPDDASDTPEHRKDDDTSYDDYNAEGFIANGAAPDNVLNEEYFGLLTADRMPKDAFVTLTNKYIELSTPIFTQPLKDETVHIGQNLSIPVAAFDPDADSIRLTVDIINQQGYILSEGILTDTGDGKGVLTWRPSATGIYRVRFSASDGTIMAWQNITITVIPDIDNMAPAIPDHVTATTVSTTQIDLAWDVSLDNAPDVTAVGYAIYRDGRQIGTSSTPSYSDIPLTPFTLYTYAISAYDAAGNMSPQSNLVSGSTYVTDMTAPSIPQNVHGEYVNSQTIVLNWSPSTDDVGVAGYSIYRNGVQVDGTTTNNYVDHHLFVGISVSYEIKAFDAVGHYSEKSAVEYVALPDTIFSIQLAGPSGSVVAGSSVNASWIVAGQPHNDDWIGLYKKGAPDTEFLAWTYLNCTQQVAGKPLSISQCSIIIPKQLAPGTYEFRYLLENRCDSMISSAPFDVAAKPGLGDVNVTGPSGSVVPGSSVTVQWNVQGQPHTDDWIGLYKQGTSNQEFLAWTYLNCTQNVGSDPSNNGQCSMTIPSQLSVGTYEFRYLIDNSSVSVAQSATFNISAKPSLGTVTLTGPSGLVLPGSSVAVQWNATGQPHNDDWVGLYQQGAADTDFLVWTYLNCTHQAGSVPSSSGQCSMTIPSQLAPGTYEFRYLIDNRSVSVATSASFVVSAKAALGTVTLTGPSGSVVAGSSVAVHWNATGQPHNDDWLGLYKQGTADQDFLAWTYLNCTYSPVAGDPSSNGQCSMTIPSQLASGTYEFRYLIDNRSISVAHSSTFDVSVAPH